MKKSVLFLLLFGIFFSSNAADTTCITIKGSVNNPLYSQAGLVTYADYSAETSQNEIVSEAWTCNAQGYPTCNFRALIKYNVSAIPVGAYVTSAKLYLYAKSNAQNGDHVNPMYGTANASLLQKVTAPWTSDGVGWLNQPATTTASQKTLPQSTSSHQNYVVDVKDFVQSWVGTPASNYGMLLRQKTEAAYNSMIFNSGQAVDSLQPTLVVCYTLTPPPPSADTCVTIAGSKSGGKYFQYEIGTYADYTADSSQNEIVSEAWTCSSMGFPVCNFRALIKYDVSQIPANTNITSAKLYLYAKTNAVNGNYGNPTFGTDNLTYLQKIAAPWSSASLGWLTQPPVDNASQKTMPQSTSQQQNYVVDITDFVQQWISHPAENYGMLMRLKNETAYNSMIFNSGLASADLQPKLVICYKKQALALSLQGFQASVQSNSNVKLAWSIVDGTSLSAIGIQRSLDGANYTKIGEIKAVNSLAETKYNFTDPSATKSTKAYYRLVLVNKDGSASYSNTLSVSLFTDGITELLVLPNPVKNALQLSVKTIKAGSSDIAIFDNYGRLVAKHGFNLSQGNNSLVINETQTLASGVYLVRVSLNGSFITRKFVKQ